MKLCNPGPWFQPKSYRKVSTKIFLPFPNSWLMKNTLFCPKLKILSTFSWAATSKLAGDRLWVKATSATTTETSWKNDSTSNFCKDLIFLAITLSRSSFCPKCALIWGPSETLALWSVLLWSETLLLLREDVTSQMLTALCYLGRVFIYIFIFQSHTCSAKFGNIFTRMAKPHFWPKKKKINLLISKKRHEEIFNAKKHHLFFS